MKMTRTMRMVPKPMYMVNLLLWTHPMIYDNNISIDSWLCRPGVGPGPSGLRCASVHRIERLAPPRCNPGHGSPVQTPPPTHAPVRAATGTPPGDPRAAATDSSRRSAAVVGCQLGDVCPAPVHGPALGGACGTQGPHRRHRAPRLAHGTSAIPIVAVCLVIGASEGVGW